MSEPTHDPDLSAVERALAGLRPSAGTFDRDALLFAAGRRSVRRGWAWPGVAVASTLAAAVLAAVLTFRPAPPRVEHTVYVEVPQQLHEDPAPPAIETPPASSPRPQTDYLTLRRQVERWGDAALPSAPSPAEETTTSDNPFDLPPDVRADPWLQRRTTQPHSGGPL
jgi:hypothetical protein